MDGEDGDVGVMPLDAEGLAQAPWRESVINFWAGFGAQADDLA